MDQYTTTAESPEQQDELQALQRKNLETLLSWRLQDAIKARESSGIEEIWVEDEDQYNGTDAVIKAMFAAQKDSKPTDQKRSQQSMVFLNITKPKTDVGVSRVQEMLLPHDDKPWEIGPTPVPELNRAAEGADDRQIMLADGTKASAQDVAKATIAKAQQASDRMTDHIEDWLVEGRVYGEMRKQIRDAGRIGTGVIKGPFPTARQDRKWNVENGVSSMEIAERIAPTSKRISAWDLYPDPSCGENLHDGAYVFERDYLTARSLRNLAKLPGYDKEVLAEVLKAGPQKRARVDRYNRETPGETQAFDTETYEVYYYYGDIPPDELIAGGWVVPGLIDAEDDTQRQKQEEMMLQLTTVSVVCTVVNDRIVRVSQNPLETGEFPYDIFVWETVDGQIWGRGIPRKMAVAQRMLNASVRALLENAGMSAGPQVVLHKGSITPANGTYEITGRKLWYWTPTDDVKKVEDAFTSVMIDSAQAQLQAIIEFALKMADELSNLPLLLQGMVGSAPDTLGGTVIQQANATSPLKAIAKQFDDGSIEPHLKRYYCWGMQDPNVPDDAKGDMQCKARGATALVQRDAAAPFLAQLFPIIKDPAFKANPEKWFAEVMRANKFNPETIQYTQEEQQQLQEQQEAQGQPKDPKVQAAEISAQAKQADREATTALKTQEMQLKAQDAEAQRAHDALLKQMEREIQVLEFAGQREISLADMKAMLATKAADIRSKHDLFLAERQFAVTEGEGRGL